MHYTQPSINYILAIIFSDLLFCWNSENKRNLEVEVKIFIAREACYSSCLSTHLNVFSVEQVLCVNVR